MPWNTRFAPVRPAARRRPRYFEIPAGRDFSLEINGLLGDVSRGSVFSYFETLAGVLLASPIDPGFCYLANPAVFQNFPASEPQPGSNRIEKPAGFLINGTTETC